jgi:hypothetical protein
MSIKKQVITEAAIFCICFQPTFDHEEMEKLTHATSEKIKGIHALISV